MYYKYENNHQRLRSVEVYKNKQHLFTVLSDRETFHQLAYKKRFKGYNCISSNFTFI